MRPIPGILCLILLLFTIAPAHAQFGDVVVYLEFVVDPNIGGGGYVEATVANVGTEPVYAVALANSLSEVIYTAPGLFGQWSPRRSSRSAWENGTVFSDYGFYTPPNTTLLDWDTYVGSTADQVLAWQVTGTGTRIEPGETLVGLRYLPGTGARALGDPVGPVPFVVFGESGEVVAEGMTALTNPVSTEATNVSHIKASFR